VSPHSKEATPVALRRLLAVLARHRLVVM